MALLKNTLVAFVGADCRVIRRRAVSRGARLLKKPALAEVPEVFQRLCGGRCCRNAAELAASWRRPARAGVYCLAPLDEARRTGRYRWRMPPADAVLGVAVGRFTAAGARANGEAAGIGGVLDAARDVGRDRCGRSTSKRCGGSRRGQERGRRRPWYDRRVAELSMLGAAPDGQSRRRDESGSAQCPVPEEVARTVPRRWCE